MKKMKINLPNEFSNDTWEKAVSEAMNEASVFDSLKEAIKTQETLSGICSKCDINGDLTVDFSENIKGIVPIKEVSYRTDKRGTVHMGMAQSRVSLKIIFKVKGYKEEKGQHIFTLSRKEAVEEVRDTYIKELKKGMVIKGVVTGFQEYGAFVDVGGDITGIILLPDLARSFVHRPEDHLEIGQLIEVVVKKANLKKNELVLSRKELLPTFEEIHKYFKAGDVVIGSVRTVRDNGIYVALNDSYEGMADYVPGRRFKHGDSVRVRVNHIDDTRRKVKLKIV